MSHTAANPACVPSSEARSLSVHAEAHVASAEELALMSLSARLLFENGQSTEEAATPAGVDMRKVAATIGVIDDVCSGRLDAAAAQQALETIGRFPPVSITRFALLAAAGAAALGVIFGATHPRCRHSALWRCPSGLSSYVKTLGLIK